MPSEPAFTLKRFQPKTGTFLSVLASRLHQNDENAYPKRRLESGDLSGDLENGASKTLINASVDRENVYVNENAGLFLPIVTCTFHKTLDFTVMYYC